MNQEETYEKIERYIDGILAGSELVDFEKQLRENPQFAAEVELHRKLHREIGDTKKMQLRGILEDIGKDIEGSDKPDSGSGKSGLSNWLLGLGGLVVLVGLGWMFSRGEAEKKSEYLVDNNKPVPSIVDTALSEIETPPEEKQVELSRPTEKPSIAKTPAKKLEKPKPPAFNNDPIPTFEAILDRIEADKIYQFELEEQAEVLPQNRILLVVAGILETAALKKEDQLVLKGFLNKPSTTLESKPYFEGPVDKEELEKSNIVAFASKKKYALQYRQELSLEPGLYYFFIGKKNNFTPIYGGKFEWQPEQ